MREGARWNFIDRRGAGASRTRYDFRPLRPFLEAALQTGITVIWDLFHYGYPDDLDPFSGEFVRRFADYCYAVARYIDRHWMNTVARMLCPLPVSSSKS